jgi:hypothetical protein
MTDEGFENSRLREQAGKAGLQVLGPPPGDTAGLRAENAHLEGEIREKELANALDQQIRTTHQVILPMSQKVGGAIGRGLGSVLQRMTESATARSLRHRHSGPIATMRIGGGIMSIGLIGIVAFCAVVLVFLLIFQVVLRTFTTKY